MIQCNAEGGSGGGDSQSTQTLSMTSMERRQV